MKSNGKQTLGNCSVQVLLTTGGFQSSRMLSGWTCKGFEKTNTLKCFEATIFILEAASDSLRELVKQFPGLTVRVSNSAGSLIHY